MLVADVQRTFADGRCTLSARMVPDMERIPGRLKHRVWFSFPEGLAPRGEPDATPFLPTALHWSMRSGEEVVIDGPVSPRVLASVDEIQSVLASLFPATMRPVSVRAEHPAEPPAGADVTACFFSRGVDSWYSALGASEADGEGMCPTHILYSPGFLTKHISDEQRARKVEVARVAAEELGLGFVAVETNLKHTFKGPILVATSLALSAARSMIPSGAMQAELRARSTHPALDHRFSSERTTIRHHGDASRMTKLARISRSPVALRLLHVCKAHHGASEGNCGRCEKCMRTQIGLHVLGALERCPAFASPLDPDDLFALDGIGEPASWLDLLHALGDGELDRRLGAGIRFVLLRHESLRLAEHARDLESDVRAISRRRRSSWAGARAERAIASATASVGDLGATLAGR